MDKEASEECGGGIQPSILYGGGDDSSCDKDGRGGEDGRGDTVYSTDCTFYLGGDRYELTVKENKDFLVAKSCVFERMFHGSLPEGDTVKITDVKPEVFMFMLNYLHEEPYCFLSKEMAMDVMHVAEKYALLELKEKCEEFLLPKRIKEVWWVAECAFLYNSTTLQNAIRDLLSKYTREFISDDNFVKISEDLVLEVVQLESVTNVTELQIFNRVLQWAKYQLRKEGLVSYDQKMLRQKLEKFLKHIRFLTMSSKDFSLGPAKSGVLNSEEVQNISEYISSAQEERITVLTVCVNTKPSTVMSEPTQKKMYPTIQVVAYSPADTMLSFRNSTLQEEVKLVKNAYLLTVIVPSQIVPSDTSCSYYQEDLQVSVQISGASYDNNGRIIPNSPKNYGYGIFKSVVPYNQEIHIPIVSSFDVTKFSTGNTNPLNYTVEINFNSKGFYPWHSPRNFGDYGLFGKQDQSSGLVMGYKFMPI